MAKNIVTLYIDDCSIRLTVTAGKKIGKCAYMPLEPSIVKNAVVLKEDELVTRIKGLFKAKKVGAKKYASCLTDYAMKKEWTQYLLLLHLQHILKLKK